MYYLNKMAQEIIRRQLLLGNIVYLYDGPTKSTLYFSIGTHTAYSVFRHLFTLKPRKKEGWQDD